MSFNMSVFRAILEKWLNKAKELQVVADAQSSKLCMYKAEYDKLGNDELEAINNSASER